MSPLLTFLANESFVLVLPTIAILAGAVGYRWGVYDTRAKMRAERRLEEAQKGLEETRKQYPESYALSE